MVRYIFSRALRNATPRFVGPSVPPSITLYFFGVLWSLASQHLPKLSSDLKNGPCPPVRNWVAVYPAFFELQAVYDEFNTILQDQTDALWIQEQFEH